VTPQMDGKRLYSLPLLVLLGVFCLSAIWEFLLEPILVPLVIEGFVDEPITERWEFVITATAFAGLSLVVPTLLLFRAAAQRGRDMAALRGSEQRFRTLFDANPAMLLIVDAKGTILSVNGFGASRLGYAADELAGRPISMLHPAETHHDLEAQLARCLESPETAHHFEMPMTSRDGSILWMRQSARVIDHPDDQPALLVVSEDITAARQLKERLSHEASHDALTGLVNRRELQERLNRALASARENGGEHALCYIDLDDFKVVNDTCGHMAGDECLRLIACALRERVRGRDTLARIAGDEFVLLMEHCSLAKAHRVAEDALKAVRDLRFTWEQHSFQVGTSIGLVAIDAGSDDPAAVLRAADHACYTAKRQGGNRVHVHRGAPPEPNRIQTVRGTGAGDVA